jgi:GTP-binding protein HflX
MSIEVIEKEEERVILVAVATQRAAGATKESVDELEELAKTAGAKTVLKVIQNLEAIVSATYIGKGKIDEIKEDIINLEATGVIVDDELSPMQLKNLEEALNVKVIDRTALILDIFAKHATTKEGIIQVELAQQKYRLNRLTGQGVAMSRLGAGIGTRGPGEKKLETDRRHIRKRISILGEELKKIKSNRDLLREGRKKQGKPIIAIVGYTNAGKSTLLNLLTNAKVLEEDMLFATLDPTTRNLTLPEGKEILLTDTVGFIRKLPHHLVEAFKSTLEEVVFADILIHVVDSSNPHVTTHMAVVYETLRMLKADDKPVITVFNKVDKEGADTALKDLRAFNTVFMSASKGEGLETLTKALETKLKEGKALIKVIIPYSEGSTLQVVRTFGQIIKEEYQNEGTYIEAYLEEALVNKYHLGKQDEREIKAFN